MSCDICNRHPIIGDVYRLQPGSCPECKHKFSDIDQATYKGIFGNLHVFKVHPTKKCPDCGLKLKYAAYRCEDMPLDVTEEYRQLVDRKAG